MSEFPPTCETCGHTDWKNPIPVAVCLQPVSDAPHSDGFMIARRAIEPNKGGWAFMGGHINRGEEAEEAACRELYEESGIRWNPHHAFYTGSIAAPLHTLLVFIFPAISLKTYLGARLCHENDAFDLLRYETPIDNLCFPAHRTIAETLWGRK